MSDVTPNYSLEIQGLDLEKAQLELNIKSQQYRIAQMNDEIGRITTNITATGTAIDAISENLLKLKGE